MPDTRSRLAQCFQAVFPELSIENVGTAAPATVRAWDSVATVTLFAVIEEEFGVALDLDELADEISFAKVLAALEQH